MNRIESLPRHAGRMFLCLVSLLIVALLGGCAVLPGSIPSGAAPAPSPVSAATEIAAAVQATLTARTVPAGSHQQTSTPSAIAVGTASATRDAAATATSSPSPAPTPVIPAPVRLAEREAGGGPLEARYWTNTSAIVFTVGAAAGASAGLRPQIELEPVSTAYKGIPSLEGQALAPGQTEALTMDVTQLPEGAYHWQARLTDGQYRGPWADFYAGPAFRLDRTPPSTVAVSSTTYPDQTRTYDQVMGHFSWTAATDNGAVQGYLSSIDRRADGVPTGSASVARTANLGPLANGTLYFHVRAEDWAGNLGPVATYVVHIDTSPPKVQHAVFDRFQFNPQYDDLTMHFTPSKDATIKVEISQQSTKGVVRVLELGTALAGETFNVSWNGRDAYGALVAPGLYTMLVLATDDIGNVGDGYYADLGVNYRRIVVHLATQSMQVFDGATLLKASLVTTGNALLPTPLGVWHIGAKFHPYKFISPWKKSSIYYYPPSDVNYALYFHSGGYFIHDAPWRTVYGPGTNTAPGPPGAGQYSGTHGCVNVPTDVAQWLYDWAPIGTVVVIEQ